MSLSLLVGMTVDIHNNHNQSLKFYQEIVTNIVGLQFILESGNLKAYFFVHMEPSFSMPDHCLSSLLFFVLSC